MFWGFCDERSCGSESVVVNRRCPPVPQCNSDDRHRRHVTSSYMQSSSAVNVVEMLCILRVMGYKEDI